MLNIEESAGASGIPVRTLQGWIQEGVFTPTEYRGEGRGHGYRFGVMQTLGLAVAEQFRASHKGRVHLSIIGGIVGAFSATKEGALLAKFRGGLTHFVAVDGDDVILYPAPRKCPDALINVEAAYNAVRAVAEADRAARATG